MRDRMLYQIYDRAVSGLPLLGTPEEMAERYQLDHITVEQTATDLARRYVILGGATGFVCGLPGYVTMPVTIPSNIAGVLLLQSHLCAAIAVLGEHDPREPAARERAIQCLRISRAAGPEETGKRGGSATGRDETKSLFSRLATKLGERGVRLAGEQATRWMGQAASRAGRNARSLPLLGGAVGGLADGYNTRQIGRRARQAFLSAA